MRRNLLLLLVLLPSLAAALTHSDVFTSSSASEPLYVRDGDAGPTLECALRPPYRDRARYDVYWSRTAKQSIRNIAQNSRLVERQNYELLEDLATGGYSLKIKKIRRGQTEGVFHCLVVDRESETGDQESIAYSVVVLVEPSDPELTQEPQGAVNETDTVVWKCASQGGQPTPTFRWTFDNRSIVDAAQHKEVTDADGNTISTLQLHAMPADNGAYLTCGVTNKAIDGVKEVKTQRLNVLFRPRVQAGPVGEYAAEAGATVELTCGAEGNPAPTSFEWRHIPSGERYLASKWSFAAERRLAGDYECRARNTLGEATDKLSLNVLYGPQIAVKDRLNPAEGETVTVDCHVDANPRAENVQWTGPGDFKQQGARLSIPSIARAQSGNYTCSATNYLQLYGESGSLVRTGHGTVFVDVKRKPGRAFIRSDSLEVLAGSDIVLECDAEDQGSPAATWEWASPTTGAHYSNTPDHMRRQLVVSSAQLADSGAYRCRAKNSVGLGEEAVVHVVVIEPAAMTRPLATERVYSAGQPTAGLECEASGYPPPRFRWLKDGQPIDATNQRYFVVSRVKESSCAPTDACAVVVESTLSWSGPTEWFDKGNYSCVAGNGPAPRAETWTRVKVLHAPVIVNRASAAAAASDQPPVAPAAGEPGESARISCRISSHPASRVVWLRESREIADGEDRYAIRNLPVAGHPDEWISVLEIAELDVDKDYGDYLCRAVNERGEKAEQIFRLQRSSAPSAPSDPRVLASGATWLLAGWRAGFDGGRDQQFAVELRPVDPATEQPSADRVAQLQVHAPLLVQLFSSSSGPTATTTSRGKRGISVEEVAVYNVTGLAPLTTYFLRVRSANSLGTSDPSPVIVADTLDVRESATAPTRPPTLNLLTGAENVTVDLPPLVSEPLCLQLYVAAQQRDWRGSECVELPAEGRPSINLPPSNTGKYRARFCRALAPHECSPLSEVIVTGRVVGASPLRASLLIPAIVLASLIGVLLLFFYLCCRLRQRSGRRRHHSHHHHHHRGGKAALTNVEAVGGGGGGKKKGSTGAGSSDESFDFRRPEVSGPMPSADAKNTAVHGSHSDSGVFTIVSAGATAAGGGGASSSASSSSAASSDHNGGAHTATTFAGGPGFTSSPEAGSPPGIVGAGGWPSAPANGAGQQPPAPGYDFSNDPYLAEFDSAAPYGTYYDEYGAIAASAAHIAAAGAHHHGGHLHPLGGAGQQQQQPSSGDNSGSTIPFGEQNNNEDEEDGDYSAGGRRVVREIIV